MTPERFRQVEAIFNEALSVAPGARSAFLGSRCGGDAELLDAVGSLLMHHDAGGVEPREAFRSAARAAAASALGLGRDGGGVEGAVGEPIRAGRYRILRRLGEGGFGVVYLAEQPQPRRTVALKLLRASMASGEVARRFEYEGRILARLSHPGIAQIYEAGVAEVQLGGGAGRASVVEQPFIAMEYVAGPNLIEYAAGGGVGGPPLSIPERLTLFSRACDALHHAHLNGVIHRDLKPDNILVASVPGTIDAGEAGASVRIAGAMPKLVDFGVARVAEADEDLTVAATAGRLIGTLAYMSPEQVSGGGGSVDSRSDVYSMGVVLYQLLSGRLPCDVRGLPLDEAVGVIRLREPAPMSTLDRAYRADANAVVLRAMAKDRERRYASIAEFAEDVRRLARGDAVEAKRDSGLYIVRKAMWRYRAVLGVAAAFLVLLAASSVVGWTLYASANRARALSDSLLRDSYLSQARASRSGDGLGRRFHTLDMLRRAAELRPGADLASEAIGALCLEDFVREGSIAAARPCTARGLGRLDRFAAVEADGSIRVRSIETGEELARLPASGVIGDRMAFSPEGAYLAAECEEEGAIFARVWRLPDPVPVLRARMRRGAAGLAFGGEAGARWVAFVGEDGAIEVESLDGGGRLGRIVPGRGAVRIAAAAGKVAALGADAEVIEVFDAGTGEPLARLAAGLGARGLAWSPGGEVLAAGGADAGIRRWRSTDWSPLPTLEGHRATVSEVVIGSDRLAVSSGWDATVRLWDLGAGVELLAPVRGQHIVGFDGERLALHDGASVVAWSRVGDSPRVEWTAPDRLGPEATCDTDPRGERLLVASAAGVQVWEIATGRTLGLADGPARSAMWLGGGRAAALVRGELLVWELGVGWPGAAPVARSVWKGSGAAWAAAHPSGGAVVISDRGSVGTIDLARGEWTDLAPCPSAAERPRLSASGQWLFYGVWGSGSACLVDVQTGEVVQEFGRGSVRGRFSPDGTRLAVGVPGDHLLVDLSRARERRRIAPGVSSAQDIAGASAISPDGSLVACVFPPSSIGLADARTGALLAMMPNPEQFGIPEVHFSGDGRHLFVLTLEPKIVAWDLDAIRAGLAAAGLEW